MKARLRDKPCSAHPKGVTVARTQADTSKKAKVVLNGIWSFRVFTHAL